MLLPILAAFTLRTASGSTETLFPARDRRATVVVFVLAECPIARKFSPEMIRLAKDYGPRGVRFLMAFADAESAAIRDQMRDYGLGFPGARADRRLIALAHAVAVPTAALVGSDGKVAYVGRIDDRFPALGVQREVRRHDLRIALDQFLAGRPVLPARTPVVGCALPSG